MLLLSVPFDQARSAPSLLPWVAACQAAAAALGLMGLGLAVERGGGALGPFGRPLMSGAIHGGFLALGCVAIANGRPGWRGPAARLAAIAVLASLLGRVPTWGALAYLVVPMALLVEMGRRPEAIAAGLTWPRLRPVLLGLAAGTFLGAHLVVSSSLTFGYAVRVDATGPYLAAVAYDIGLNALTAEWLFRGALFSRWWRRWAFGSAAALSIACAVLRYLLDPNLPPAVEVRLGAVFYIGLLGFSACALRAWSGSVVPGYLATTAFFLVYRALSN